MSHDLHALSAATRAAQLVVVPAVLVCVVAVAHGKEGSMSNRETQALQQAQRRADARERGDCQCCCKRPVQPGFSKCEECNSYQRKRQNWKGGTHGGRAFFVEMRPVAGASSSFRLVVR